jgi:putative phosphoesterase
MKLFVASDIHGSFYYCKKMIEEFEKDNYDYLVLLGDILYHGPRNELSMEYDCKKVSELLNKYKDKIIAVKGNCDAEVDQMVLNFEILDSYDSYLNGLDCHFEHGHHLDLYNGNAELVFTGHTHIPLCEEKEGYININPGSITIPKNGSKKSYIIWEDHNIKCLDMKNNIVFEYNY